MGRLSRGLLTALQMAGMLQSYQDREEYGQYRDEMLDLSKEREARLGEAAMLAERNARFSKLSDVLKGVGGGDYDAKTGNTLAGLLGFDIDTSEYAPAPPTNAEIQRELPADRAQAFYRQQKRDGGDITGMMRPGMFASPARDLSVNDLNSRIGHVRSRLAGVDDPARRSKMESRVGRLEQQRDYAETQRRDAFQSDTDTRNAPIDARADEARAAAEGTRREKLRDVFANRVNTSLDAIAKAQQSIDSLDKQFAIQKGLIPDPVAKAKEHASMRIARQLANVHRRQGGGKDAVQELMRMLEGTGLETDVARALDRILAARGGEG